MKKLMIAALVAAMGGVVVAADCGEPLTCPFVYRVKLAGKTVAAAATASNKVTCVDGACWVKPASLRIAGYLYGTGDEETTTVGSCGEEVTSCVCKDGDKYVENFVFWDANKKQVKFDSVAFDLFEVLRNGGAQNKAQVVLKLDDLTLAGFAAYNPVTGNIKSANGFFAGKLPAAKCVNVTITDVPCEDPEVETEETNASVFAPCALATAIDSTASVAFGRWNIAYKADKAALANELCVKQGYTAETVWEVPGLVKPTAFVAAE